MLSIQNLCFKYENHKPLFEDISFDLKKGQVLRLKGSNGRGKSTLLKCLLGLLNPERGEVHLDGNSDLDYFKSQTEYLAPENNALFEDMSAMENLKTWLTIRQERPSQAEILEILNIWGFHGQYLIEKMPVGKYSTGMKRRLAIVRVRLSAKRLWLLDEPLYGLTKTGFNYSANF